MHATPDLDLSEVDLRCMRPRAWIPPTSIVVRRRELAAALAATSRDHELIELPQQRSLVRRIDHDDVGPVVECPIEAA